MRKSKFSEAQIAMALRQAFDLCVAFENVYCDFGYLDEVRTKAGKKELRKKLRELGGTDRGAARELEAMTSCDCAQRQVPRRYDIRDKILYGSDWMMSVRVGGHRKFITDFEKVFVDDLATWRDEFFCRNAKKAFRLDDVYCEWDEPSGAS